MITRLDEAAPARGSSKTGLRFNLKFREFEEDLRYFPCQELVYVL